MFILRNLLAHFSRDCVNVTVPKKAPSCETIVFDWPHVSAGLILELFLMGASDPCKYLTLDKRFKTTDVLL